MKTFNKSSLYGRKWRTAQRKRTWKAIAGIRRMLRLLKSYRKTHSVGKFHRIGKKLARHHYQRTKQIQHFNFERGTLTIKPKNRAAKNFVKFLMNSSYCMK